MPMRGLTIIVATAEAERFHAALSIAAAQVALGGTARVYLHGGAAALLDDLAAPDDERRASSGLPTLAQLFDEALLLGVTMIACQSGIALAGLGHDRLDHRIQPGGLVSLMAALGDDRLLTL